MRKEKTYEKKKFESLADLSGDNALENEKGKRHFFPGEKHHL